MISELVVHILNFIKKDSYELAIPPCTLLSLIIIYYKYIMNLFNYFIGSSKCEKCRIIVGHTCPINKDNDDKRDINYYYKKHGVELEKEWKKKFEKEMRNDIKNNLYDNMEKLHMKMKIKKMVKRMIDYSVDDSADNSNKTENIINYNYFTN